MQITNRDYFLEGNEIYLRTLRKSDLQGNWPKWFNDKETTYFLYNGIFPVTEESQLAFYNEVVQSKTNLVLAICLKKTNEHIGNVGLHNMDFFLRKAELGIIIGEKQYHGRGYATEAVQLLTRHGLDRINLHKIYLRTEENNSAAIKMFMKAGFKKEGLIREETCHHGKWFNSVYMGLLAKDLEV
jgi:ribosomal-protein-alanine N-acetyltransferase